MFETQLHKIKWKRREIVDEINNYIFSGEINNYTLPVILGE